MKAKSVDCGGEQGFPRLTDHSFPAKYPRRGTWNPLPQSLDGAAVCRAFGYDCDSALVSADWWAKHCPKIALALGLVTLGYYLIGLHAYTRVLHGAIEYVSFIMLVGSLFVVSGGIHINVKGEATPAANVLFLLIGAVVANLLGTTGASMLLIRPWIRMNKYRITAHHIVFFIFVVSNVGGCLTPIGDPPLFLGYLKGVPFWWVAEHCWPMWATGLGVLLAMFYVVDRLNFQRAPKVVREKETDHAQWRFDGLGNVCFLAVILGAVFIHKPLFLGEALMVGGQWGLTSPRENRFTR